MASSEQPLGDVAAGVAEGTRYYVQLAIISHCGPVLPPNVMLSGALHRVRSNESWVPHYHQWYCGFMNLEQCS